MQNRQLAGYSGLQIGLHWLIAALVFFQLVFGESMTTVVDANAEGTAASPADIAFSTAHYWFGLSILALVAMRLALRLVQGVPPKTNETSTWMSLAAKLVHWLFYGLLIAVPVVGLLALYVAPDLGDIHALAKPAFIILISLHVIAALFHQLVLKDGTLKRMFVSSGRTR
ncbi:MAG: cytochrome [Devosia sp.]|uniref:cytochrome b n=1 Tax=Devosia sp. TaxID=1871048 RepID=UPI00260AB2EE|nr:cytochrome b [Devosia sp.]MDB5527412.1 cytochrome [Devosia sp.]